jgi:hypothetical protein
LITSLFFQCYYAFLKGNLPDAEMYFQFLKEEFAQHQTRQVLLPRQLKTLKMIREAIRSKKIHEMAWLDEPQNPNNAVPDQKYEFTQTELVKEIHLELSQIKDLLHPMGNLYLYNIEHPCGSYGAVDMVYQDDVFAYPLEVKIGQGKHDLLGQILKYELFFRLQLHLGMYREVQPVTLCSHYQDFVLKELKKRNIITLRYDRDKKGLKLYRI